MESRSRFIEWMPMGALGVLLAWPALAAGGEAEALKVLSDPGGTMVHDYVMARVTKQFDARRDETAKALQSPDAAAAYQKLVREKYRKLIGSFGPKTPLNPVVTGTIACDGYRIEKVAYESVPNHYVTANFYVPTTGEGPWPGVLVLCGHADAAKAYDSYQRACILLAKNGLAALIVDPVSQGEMVQILDENREPVMEDGVYIYSKKIYEHTIIDYGSRLVGRSTVAYELWDNVRSIDYLLSRKEVDRSKPIGCTGNSGGGTQTTFLMAWDDRIGPAAPACYVSTLEWVFSARDFDDGCQHLAGEGAARLERADYLVMRAPKPTLVLAGSQDTSFAIASTRAAYADARRFYDVLGCSDRLDMFEGDHAHGFHQPLREKAVRWMRRWLVGDGRPVVEPKLTVQEEKDLQVTPTGQVGSHWKDSLLVPDLNLLRAEELASDRERFWKEGALAGRREEVRKLIGLRGGGAKAVGEKVGAISRKGYRIEKLIISRGEELPIPALLCVPDDIEGRRATVLYVDGRGKGTDAGAEGAIEDLVRQGHIVLAIDVRGFGETKNVRPYGYASYMYSDDYKNLMLSMHLGRPMLGQRVEEVLACLDFLAGQANVDTNAIGIVGVGRAGPVALHAAFLDDRIKTVTLYHSITSWIDLLKAPLAKQVLTHIVPWALTRYDLTDLVRAIAPRPVNIVDPVDAFGKPVAGG